VLGIADYYRALKPWVSRGGAIVLRFENLVGPLGGGCPESQHSELQKIARALGIVLEPASIRAMAEKLFDKSGRGFRKGQIGVWREHFSPKLARVFDDMAGKTVEEWGYEQPEETQPLSTATV
jgi:hypothetical protein